MQSEMMTVEQRIQDLCREIEEIDRDLNVVGWRERIGLLADRKRSARRLAMLQEGQPGCKENER